MPVSEYDSDLLDGFPKGDHLVSVYPGGQSRRYNIDPNYAAMIAAGRVAESAISDAILKASEIRMRDQEKIPLTDSQRKAWENLIKEFGPSARSLERASARGIAEEGVKAMQQEADRLLSNPAVRKAWDYFQMICDLTREQEEPR